MDEHEFKRRTKEFSLGIIRLVEMLPPKRAAWMIGRQLLRSGTSVGANYRSACRGRSRADMIAKLRVVEEECDEAIYWMELLVESKLVSDLDIRSHLREAHEILAMVVASIRTMLRRAS